MRYLKYGLIMVLILFSALRSEIPNNISYQGILKDSGGNTLDGSYNLLFKLYTVESGGTAIWSDSNTSVDVDNGVFSVLLDNLDALNFESEYWLGISINTSSELTPRTKLSSVPYSFISQTVADGSITTDKISSTGAASGQAIMYNGTDIVWDTPSGGGLTLPISETYSSYGDAFNITVTNTSGSIFDLEINNTSNTGHALDIRSNGQGDMIELDYNDGGGKVIDIDNDGTNDAVYINNSSSSNDALEIYHYGDNAIEITNNGTGGSIDIDNNSGADNAIYIDNDASCAIEIDHGADDTGAGPALYIKNSSNKSGISVRNTSYDAGFAGQFSIENTSNNMDALYARTSGSGAAAYFVGNVAITGNVSKGGGSFKIDHPLDPENKYLFHSFVESSDMMNVYNGNVMLDGNGEAYIELPDYFEALNKDFRYQLTTIGGYSPVYIAEEISNNRFKIAGGDPNLKVSWQVTGVRKDPYAENNRIQVEVNKLSEERGRYLHYKEYNQPIENSIQALKEESNIKEKK